MAAAAAGNVDRGAIIIGHTNAADDAALGDTATAAATADGETDFRFRPTGKFNSMY